MAAVYYLSEHVTVKVVNEAILLCVEDELTSAEVHAELTVKEAFEIAHALAKAGYDVKRSEG